MSESAKEQNDISQKIEALEKQTLEPGFSSSPYAKDVLKELVELRAEKEQQEKALGGLPQKDVFLIITRDASIFNSTLPAGKLVADISSFVPELHIVFIGGKQKKPEKINNNTFLYTARYIPGFSFFTVYQVILSEVIWKKRFLPTMIVSLGDEVVMAKIFAKKYGRPLHVFYSYMKLLGKSNIPMATLVRLAPQKIIVPNEYIKTAIENYHGYDKQYTKVKILNEYLDVPELENTFNEKQLNDEAEYRNNIFNMIVFPRRVNIVSFFKLYNIGRGISKSIRKFQFTIVAKRGQYVYAKILRSVFALPAIVVKENKESINLFRTARLMLYFDLPKIPYDPVFYSLISGCPVVSSGDEYSKIILFDSGFEEFTHIDRHSRDFVKNIKKLVNDPYLYEKYKMNCVGFAKSAFTHDHTAYMQELKDSLKVSI